MYVFANSCVVKYGINELRQRAVRQLVLSLSDLGFSLPQGNHILLFYLVKALAAFHATVCVHWHSRNNPSDYVHIPVFGTAAPSFLPSPSLQLPREPND
jgi:hypothetical protein